MPRPIEDRRLAFLRRATDPPRRRFRRGVYLLPSLFTLGNLFCGYACIVYAMRGEFETAAPFIGFAVVLDSLDGRIARLTGGESEFGLQFDSIADIVSFGVVQDIELATTAGQVSVALVLDLSGSVEQEGIEDLERACQALVDALEPADRAWLITFADAFALKAGPAQDRPTLRRALENLRPGGGTSMWDAMFAAVSLVSGTEGRSLVLAFTDGVDTTSWLDEDRALDGESAANLDQVGGVVQRRVLFSPGAVG